jgi:hypothetical protein
LRLTELQCQSSLSLKVWHDRVEQSWICSTKRAIRWRWRKRQTSSRHDTKHRIVCVWLLLLVLVRLVEI